MSATDRPQPNGKYRTWVVSDQTIHVSGMTPRIDGEVAVVGRVGDEVSIDSARTAAEICAGRVLACLEEGAGSLAAIRQVLTLTVYVAASPGFDSHGRIADRVSEVLHDALGERSISSRVAVGVSSLPGNAAVEVALSASLSAAVDREV